MFICFQFFIRAKEILGLGKGHSTSPTCVFPLVFAYLPFRPGSLVGGNHCFANDFSRPLHGTELMNVLCSSSHAFSECFPSVSHLYKDTKSIKLNYTNKYHCASNVLCKLAINSLFPNEGENTPVTKTVKLLALVCWGLSTWGNSLASYTGIIPYMDTLIPEQAFLDAMLQANIIRLTKKLEIEAKSCVDGSNFHWFHDSMTCQLNFFFIIYESVKKKTLK